MQQLCEAELDENVLVALCRLQMKCSYCANCFSLLCDGIRETAGGVGEPDANVTLKATD